MPSIPRISDLDASVWRAATLSTPFVVQIVLGLELVAMWALGKGAFTSESGRSERTWMLTASAIITLVSLGVSVLLLRSPSLRNRGLGLSVAASAAVVIIGSTVYAYLILR